jgi:putative protease
VLRKQFDGQIFIWTPAVLKDVELNNAIDALKNISELSDGFCAGSPGALQLLKETFPETELCADFSMNLFNDEALVLQKSLGIMTCMISPELRLSEVKDMSSPGLELEGLVYGRVPLMTMEHCPSAAETGCSGLCGTCARKRGLLKDRKGEIFPFVRDPVRMRTQIFNTVPVFMDDTAALKDTQLSILRLSFTNEDQVSQMAVLRHYANKIKGLDADRENERIIENLKDRGYTKGHWFRGV